jgi:hypothetical protein
MIHQPPRYFRSVALLRAIFTRDEKLILSGFLIGAIGTATLIFVLERLT